MDPIAFGDARSAELTDLTIVCDGREYKVHRALVCREENWFEKNCKEPGARMSINLWDPNALHRVLQYLYGHHYEDDQADVTDLTTLSRELSVRTHNQEQSLIDILPPTHVDDLASSLESLSLDCPTVPPHFRSTWSHIAVYSAAVDLQIDPLIHLSHDRLVDSFRSNTLSDGLASFLVICIDFTENRTILPSRLLQDLLRVCIENGDKILSRPEFTRDIKRQPALAFALFRKMVQMRIETSANMPVASSISDSEQGDQTRKRMFGNKETDTEVLRAEVDIQAAVSSGEITESTKNLTQEIKLLRLNNERLKRDVSMAKDTIDALFQKNHELIKRSKQSNTVDSRRSHIHTGPCQEESSEIDSLRSDIAAIEVVNGIVSTNESSVNLTSELPAEEAGRRSVEAVQSTDATMTLFQRLQAAKAAKLAQEGGTLGLTAPDSTRRLAASSSVQPCDVDYVTNASRPQTRPGKQSKDKTKPIEQHQKPTKAKTIRQSQCQNVETDLKAASKRAAPSIASKAADNLANDLESANKKIRVQQCMLKDKSASIRRLEHEIHVLRQRLKVDGHIVAHPAMTAASTQGTGGPSKGQQKVCEFLRAISNDLKACVSCSRPFNVEIRGVTEDVRSRKLILNCKSCGAQCLEENV